MNECAISTVQSMSMFTNIIGNHPSTVYCLWVFRVTGSLELIPAIYGRGWGTPSPSQGHTYRDKQPLTHMHTYGLCIVSDQPTPLSSRFWSVGGSWREPTVLTHGDDTDGRLSHHSSCCRGILEPFYQRSPPYGHY